MVRVASTVPTDSYVHPEYGPSIHDIECSSSEPGFSSWFGESKYAFLGVMI